MLGGKSSEKGPKQHMDYRINPKVLPQLGLNKHADPDLSAQEQSNQGL